MPQYRVHHGRVLAGYTADRQRIQIPPYRAEQGQPVDIHYTITRDIHDFGKGVVDEPALWVANLQRFEGANPESLWVRLVEYPDLVHFPDLPDEGPLIAVPG